MNNFSAVGGRDSRVSNIPVYLPLGIISFGADGVIDFINPAFIKMGNLFNLKPSTLYGKNVFTDEIIPGTSFTKEFNELKDGYPFEKEIKHIQNSHTEINLIVKASPYYEDDNFSGGIIILEDLKVLSDSRENDAFQIASFKLLIKDVIDLFFIVDAEGKIKYSAGKKLPLYNIAENNSITELIPWLPKDFNQNLNTTFKEGTTDKIILTHDAGSKQFFYECIINPLYIKHKKFLSCTFIDIEKKIESEKLEYRLNQFRKIADTLSDGIIGLDAEGKINFWSPSLLSFTGYYEEEISGKNIEELIPELNNDNLKQLKEDLQQIQFFKKQINILSKDKNIKHAQASFLPGDDESIFISINSVTEDTPHLTKAERNLHNLFYKTDALILKLNRNGDIEFANPSFNSLFSFKEDEAVHKNINEFVDDGIIDFSSTKSFYRDIVLKTKTGEKKYFLACFTPIIKGDEVSGFNAYLINQTDKIKENRDLQFFKLLFENIKEGIAVETKGRIISANNMFANIFGYSSFEEIMGKDILDLTAANNVLKVAEYLQLYHSRKEVPQRFEFLGKRKDGSTFTCELSPSVIKSEGHLYFIFTVQDITEKKIAQQIICESEEKYRNLIENIDDFLFTLERSRLFFKPVFFTHPVEKITGYSREEMLKDIKLLIKIIHPDDIPAMKENIKKFSRSRNKMSAEFEFRIINRQGNVVWVRSKLSVTRNASGDVEKVYGLVSDISLRKKAEEDLQKTTQNLVKLNETKDRFISIISHDLRTPFSSILGFTDLLLNDETLTPDERNQYVKYIQESSNSMLALVNSLLDWTRLQTGRIRFEPEKADVSEVISKSINALSGAAFQKNISITSTVQENLYLFIDKDLIGQVFNNLISNAIKFTHNGGSIVISAEPYQYSRFFEFSVKDNGIGIKPEDAKKLFGVDTKYSTEGTAGEKGTGLGLSLVKEIIEKHGGSVRIESEPGSGTNVLFTLPVAAANILLIDSNTTDRILYSKILKHITADYNIDTAANGKEALNKLASSTYALIVTEHKMPVMGGYDFVLELKKLDLKVKPPVIVLSNSVDRQVIDDYNELGISQVFSKPVNISIFKQAVEKSLHEGLK